MLLAITWQRAHFHRKIHFTMNCGLCYDLVRHKRLACYSEGSLLLELNSSNFCLIDSRRKASVTALM